MANARIIKLKSKLLPLNMIYRIAGKFDKSFLICQTKTIQISTYNYNLLANQFIHQIFFHQMLKTSKFAKLYPHQTFPLYGIELILYICKLF